MGLLDKVDNLEEKKPAAKKPAAKKAPPKAVKVAKPKAVKAEINLVEDEIEPMTTKTVKIRPTGLPEGFELAGNMPRYIGWLLNFGWNFGVVIGLLVILGSGGDPDLTIGWALAAIMILFNWLVVPIWLGRNIGEFASRTKYINSGGNKPIFLHAVLNNSLGFMALTGLILVFVNMSEAGEKSAIIWLSVGAIMTILWVVNFFFKKNSDYSQGLFDLIFSAYLVKHISEGTETGWAAKFENLGDFGDKWAAKQAERKEKAAKKAEERAKKAAEAKPEGEDDSEDESKED